MSLKKTLRLSLITLLLINTPSWAGLLCDPGCQLEIDFTYGGSIEAVEQVTLVFGDSGLIDTGSTSTAYVKDETLTLNAGESLVFTDGGSLSLGDAGNIDCTHLSFNVDGSIAITSGPESTTLVIDSDQTLSFSGDASLELNIDILKLYGSLYLGDETQTVIKAESININADSSLESPSCTSSNTAGSGSTLSTGAIIEPVPDSNCIQIISGTTITGGELLITGGEISIGGASSSIAFTGQVNFSQAETVNETKESSGSFNPLLLILLAALGIFRFCRSGRND